VITLLVDGGSPAFRKDKKSGSPKCRSFPEEKKPVCSTELFTAIHLVYVDDIGNPKNPIKAKTEQLLLQPVRDNISRFAFPPDAETETKENRKPA